MSASDSPELVCVDPKRIEDLWPHIKQFVRAAMRRSDMGRFDELEPDILTGGALVWLAWRRPVIEAVAVTQIVATELSKVCAIRACGGYQHERWIGLLDQIEAYAKAEGCRCTRIVGRKGWSRVLKNYRTTRIVLERQL